MPLQPASGSALRRRLHISANGSCLTPQWRS